MLPAWLVLLLCSIQCVSSFVFSCEEIRDKLINSPRIEGTTQACVFLEEGLSNTTSYLNNVYLQDQSSKRSLAVIAPGCVQGKGPWQVVSEKPADYFMCTKEVTIIFSSDETVEYVPVTEEPVHREGDGKVVFVSPGAGMRITVNNLNGATMDIYTGAGKGSGEGLYAMAEWGPWNMPQYISTFDNVITIDTQQRDVVFWATTDYQNVTRLGAGDRAAILTSGKSDNLMNKHPAENHVTYDLLESATAHVQGSLAFDPVYKGYINISVKGDIMNEELSFTDYDIDWTFYGSQFEVKYLTAVKPEDLWNNDDTFVINIQMSELPSEITRAPTTAGTAEYTGPTGPTQTTQTTTPRPTTTTTRPTTKPAPTGTYPDTADTSIPIVTTRAPATTSKQPETTTTGKPVNTNDYCNCRLVDDWFDNWDPAEIWVDVVILLDTSASMGGDSLEEAKSLITSFISQMTTDTSAQFYSRIGVIAVAETAQVIYNLNMSSTDDLTIVQKHPVERIDVGAAFQAALSMFADGTMSSAYRENARRIIYYLTNSAPGANLNGVEEFKSDGGTIVVNDFLLEGQVAEPGLRKLASENFFFTDLSDNYIKSLAVFCEVNCFCDDMKHAYNDDVMSPRTSASLGCYHPVNNGIPQPNAKSTCEKEGGYLVSVHDQQKEHFVNSVVSIFGNKKKYWIGYEYVNGRWVWQDQSTDQFSDWDTNQPDTSGGKNCAYAVQTTGLNVKWTAAPCAMGAIVYVCESPPCSRGNNKC